MPEHDDNCPHGEHKHRPPMAAKSRNVPQTSIVAIFCLLTLARFPAVLLTELGVKYFSKLRSDKRLLCNRGDMPGSTRGGGISCLGQHIYSCPATRPYNIAPTQYWMGRNCFKILFDSPHTPSPLLLASVPCKSAIPWFLALNPPLSPSSINFDEVSAREVFFLALVRRHGH